MALMRVNWQVTNQKRLFNAIAKRKASFMPFERYVFK